MLFKFSFTNQVTFSSNETSLGYPDTGVERYPNQVHCLSRNVKVLTDYQNLEKSL